MRAEGVPTYNQRGQRSGPCRLWGGLDKARHIVPTALLVRVQCFRKGSIKGVEGPSTRPIVFSMITGSYWRRRRRLTIFEPDEKKSVCLWPSLVCLTCPHSVQSSYSNILPELLWYCKILFFLYLCSTWGVVQCDNIFCIVSTVFTKSKPGRTDGRTHTHGRMHGTTAALLYPHRNALRGDNKYSDSLYDD